MRLQTLGVGRWGYLHGKRWL